MISGGIYDQIGGGLCRYSTDHQWHVPHFEKMLNKSGLLGWGVATKITPQGKISQGGDYATAMTYDVYDNLKNVMLHMAGSAAIEGLPIEKISPANFSIRGIFSVVTGTE